MLNRRILRIKAFKTVYALAENQSMTMKEAEAQLTGSCEATRSLYLFMLALIPAITDEARARTEAARAKFNPTEEERHPNLKFVENSIAPILREDPDFQKILSKRKLGWDQYDVLIRHLYEALRDSDYFAAYMSDAERSTGADAALFVRFFERELVDNAELEDILEDMSIWWNDDLAYALTWCCKSVEELGNGRRWNLPPLYQSDLKPGMASDRNFVTELLRTAFVNFDKYCSAIAECTPKWDKERICTTDMALIVCGLAEADRFADIPTNVTLNEFVEISKYYSTSESRAFVNGILNKLIKKK